MSTAKREIEKQIDGIKIPLNGDERYLIKRALKVAWDEGQIALDRDELEALLIKLGG